MNDALSGGMRPRDEYICHTSAPVSSQELCQGENPNIAAAVSISEQDANIFIILHTRFVTGNESEKDPISTHKEFLNSYLCLTVFASKFVSNRHCNEDFSWVEFEKGTERL